MVYSEMIHGGYENLEGQMGNRVYEFLDKCLPDFATRYAISFLLFFPNNCRAGSIRC